MATPCVASLLFHRNPLVYHYQRLLHPQEIPSAVSVHTDGDVRCGAVFYDILLFRSWPVVSMSVLCDSLIARIIYRNKRTQCCTLLFNNGTKQINVVFRANVFPNIPSDDWVLRRAHQPSMGA